MILVDSYVFKSRITPAIILGFPAVFCFNILFGLNSAIVPSIIIIVICFIIEQIIRDYGKKAEITLLKEWGGYPTTLLLRHKTRIFDDITLQRYHSFLGTKVGSSIPDLKTERQNLAKADKIYNSCIEWLKSNTRDKQKFYLVFQENTNYGLRRNIYGIKHIALVFQIILSISFIFFILFSTNNGIKTVYLSIVAFILIIDLFFWGFVVKSKWVKKAAIEYARQLITSIDKLK